jgi:hypothetical protein
MRIGSGRRPRAAAAAAAAAAPWPSESQLLPRRLPACLPQRRRRRPCTTARAPREKRSRGGGLRVACSVTCRGQGQGGCCTRRTPTTTPAPPRVPPPAPCLPACLPACPRLGQSLGDGPEAPPQSVGRSVSQSVGDAEDGELQGGGGSWAAAAAAGSVSAPGQPRATTPSHREGATGRAPFSPARGGKLGERTLNEFRFPKTDP